MGHSQRYRALMVILQSHRTQNMILRCYPNVAICYTSEIYQILSPVLFQQSLYFPLLIHRIFYLLVIYRDCRKAKETSSDTSMHNRVCYMNSGCVLGCKHTHITLWMCLHCW